uniref:RYDR_ITPR domain-containing protein n=1 Tax=Steinernema glaseri TaxID=37863 RepID=A0A1I7ZEI1_9BILA
VMTNLDEAVAEEHALEEQHTQAAVGVLGQVYLRSTTLIRKCTDQCPVLVAAEAVRIRDLIEDLLIADDQSTPSKIEVVCQEDGVLNWLQWYSPCYAGLRTILRRLRDVIKYDNLVRSMVDALQTSDVKKIQGFCDGQGLPQPVLDIILKNYYTHVSSLSEPETVQRYGQLVTSFRGAINENETAVCVICRQFNLPSEISEVPVTGRDAVSDYRGITIPECYLPDEVREDATVKNVDACRMCLRALRANRRTRAERPPPYAVVNGNTVEPIPDALQGLNWIEFCLIQLVRPVQNIKNL